MLTRNSGGLEAKTEALFDNICDTIEAAGCETSVALGILAALLVGIAHQDGMSKRDLVAGIVNAYERGQEYQLTRG